jgi:hypothetical protein
MNKDTKKPANITPGPGKDIFLRYYKELWTDNSLQENCSNTENLYILTMEKLREHKKIENNLEKISYILKRINLQETYFFRNYWFLIIFI